VPRIDGKLALSRAIGDDSFKDLDEDPATWAVTSVPEVRSVDYRPGDVLVLACDGLFDVCENAVVAQLVVGAGTAAAPQQLAQLLADEALKRGSDDNVTVVVAKL
jgi:serine/threonine protein phosphatase PrpC